MLKTNEHELSDVCRDFHNITNLNIVLYDDRFREVYHPVSLIRFCQEIRRDATLSDKCLACDRAGFAECKAKKAPVIYQCHMGLTEAIVPIIQEGLVIGYLIVGQTLEAHNRSLVEDAILSLPKDCRVDRELLLRLLKEMKPYPHDKLLSCAHIMEICANHLWASNIVSFQKNTLRLQLIDYVQANLASEHLTLRDICNRFSVSRSFLYDFSVKEFGMGISDYIRKCRLEQAQKLLMSGEHSVCRISELCGFSTPSYFTKVFFKEFGILPKNYARERNTVC